MSVLGKSSKRENLFNEIHTRLKGSFSKIKEELDDYRECLNQNTNEIQSNYEYICRLDAKIDKLAERLDELTMVVQQSKEPCEQKEQFSVSTLTRKEQEIFMAIYVSDNGASYAEIARKAGLTENLVVCYATNLIAKGVPLIKQYLANGVRLYIDENFRQVQAKQNILKINESVAQSIN